MTFTKKERLREFWDRIKSSGFQISVDMEQIANYISQKFREGTVWKYEGGKCWQMDGIQSWVSGCGQLESEERKKKNFKSWVPPKPRIQEEKRSQRRRLEKPIQ